HTGATCAALAAPGSPCGSGRLYGRHQIDATLASIRRRVELAGGNPDAITIVGVTKGQPVDVCRAAVSLGLGGLGENRVQEQLSKMDDVPGAVRNLLGHLRSFKGRATAPCALSRA